MSPDDDLEVDPAVDADEPDDDESIEPAALPIDLDAEANPADLYEQELPVVEGDEDGPRTT
jgi:hypothetical protein